MLTVKGFGSAKDALAYYSHGDYYGSEGMGTWYGAGADELGLGPVLRISTFAAT